MECWQKGANAQSVLEEDLESLVMDWVQGEEEPEGLGGFRIVD